jgi:ribosomal protein L22
LKARQSQARYVRVSPQKARLVIDLIRGQRAEEALQTLQFTKKRIAKDVRRRCAARSPTRSARRTIPARRSTWTRCS